MRSDGYIIRSLSLIAMLIIMTVAISACTTAVNVNTETAAEAKEPAKEEPKKPDGQQEVKQEETLYENSEEFIASAAEEAAPSLDISNCYTFTHIVDEAMSPGMGYANVTIGDKDALLVSSGVYDNLDGNMAAIDATVFIYKDNSPYEAGKVCSAGTAYPIAVKDGMLYTGSNHWICKYTMEEDKLTLAQTASVSYDSEGNPTYEGEYEKLSDEMQKADIVDFTKKSDTPPYEYPGPELFYYVLYQYIGDELGKGYPESDVTIPCPIIIAEDESDKDDIKIWGDFQVFNYNLNQDTLECASGGSYPGCIHLRSVDDSRGYVVTKMDLVEDGSNYDPTAKKIFGKYYDDFVKSGSDEKLRETTRAQIIANYVYANNLNIKAYKDYGWDPVPLPEQNIDNFYSQLD